MYLPLYKVADTPFHIQAEYLLVLAAEQLNVSLFFTDLDMAYFWKWTDFASYVEFLLTLSALVGLVTYFLLNVTVYIEGLGFMAVLFEALLGAPQFYRNYQKKSTQGMR